ncbi:iron ABC transporter permease [Corynebacterium sp.]|uniref:ABC transporter permease n=1 Tax=Corynebacterium sp. TaxID=1720 RepID=UPI0026DF8FCE|nr:iron ABC transporter permease [Corynebacterium sp.]MDO5512137.1 iron ABC transporter permease [Corynebacterium sp.]
MVWILTAVILTVLFFIIGLPVTQIFFQGTSGRGLEALIQAVSPGSTHFQALLNTMLLGTLVGIVGTIFGFSLALAQVRLDFAGKKAMHLLALLPLISPPFAVATAVITLFGRRGIITYNLFGLEVDIYGLPGLVLVLAMSFTPVAYMNFVGMIRNLDPSLEEAASSLGANPLKTMSRVILPMLLPGFAASFLLLFVESIADLANPLVLGGDFQVLASQIYFAVAGDGDIARAAGIAIVLLLPSILVFLVQRYWVSRKSVISVTGKPAGKPRPLTNPWLKYPILLFALFWALMIALIYLTIVIGGLTQILGVNNRLTFDHYRFVYRLGSEAIVTTTWMTLIAAPIAALLGVLIAWLVVRRIRRFAGVLDFIGMLGMAIPGTVLGLGFALAFSSPTWLFGYQVLPPLAAGTAIGGGAIAIIMVYVARGIPAGQQSTIAALRQINPALEEAATSLGADPVTSMRKVTLPLVVPSIITALTYAITRSMTVITAIIFIVTPQTKVMTAQILDEVDAGRFGNAFAYCTLLIVIVLIILGITEIITRYINRNSNLRTD